MNFHRPTVVLLALTLISLVGGSFAVFAQELAPHQVKSLTVEQAQNLKLAKNGLSFDKLTELSPAVAAVLAKYDADLRFGALTSLSRETAKALAVRKMSLTFTKLSELPPDVAEALGSFEGPTLSVGGFSELSPESAKNLANFKGTLELPDLKMVSAEAAAALAECKGEVYLRGLTNLTSVPLATKFGLQQSVRLENLATISDDAAHGLFTTKKKGGGTEFYLGLKEISLETAKAMAARGRVSGVHFHFHGVESIPDEVAETFAFGGGAIRFHKVTKISDRVVKALTKFSYVHMYALSDVSPEGLEMISRGQSFQVHGLTRIDSVPFASTLLTRNNVFLSLNRVETFSDEAADAMAKGGKGRTCPPMPSLKALNSVHLAELLASQKGSLRLPKLETVTDDVVKALAAHQGDLDLSGLTALTPARAKALANRQDSTGLNGVTELTDDAATELSKARGAISLSKLAKVSASGTAALRSNTAISLPKTLK
jgi:hypothetical protein